MPVQYVIVVMDLGTYGIAASTYMNPHKVSRTTGE